MAAKEFKTFLLLLSELEFTQFQQLLSQITSQQKLALREVVVNFLQNKIALDSSVVKKLKPYKQFLLKLAYSKVDRKLIAKRARSLWILLKAVKIVIKDL